MFRKLLVANRGEIAVRVMRACREMGIGTVAVYSEADARALHVLGADEAVCIGPPPAAESYLNIAAILDAARRTGADAVHPGYGFLSENPRFAQACLAAGLVWVGPPPAAMRAMASKIDAKRLAAELGVPLLSGYQGDDQDERTLAAEAARTGYPLLIKASAGGGGRGMRVVDDPTAFGESLAAARREALSAFGDDAVLIERYVRRPRHIEIQVFGDTHGQVMHLGERECSVQRRHQKVIEESPSPALTPALREAMGAAAVRLARAIDYTGAGTVEFLLDEAGEFAFLEMNTRLQVEHGVTELVTGLDLVHLQLQVAAGEPLPFAQDDLRFAGHAIQCRVYAEDPSRGYLPSAGRLTRFAPPSGDGIRNDLGVYEGVEVTSHYDALLAKLLVYGDNRTAAIAHTAAALAGYAVEGVTTNLALLRAAVVHPEFVAGRTFTTFLEEHVLPAMETEGPPVEALLGAAAFDLLAPSRAAGPWSAGPWRQAGAGARLVYEHNGERYTIHAARVGHGAWNLTVEDESAEAGSPRPGTASSSTPSSTTTPSSPPSLAAPSRPAGGKRAGGLGHHLTIEPLAPDRVLVREGTRVYNCRVQTDEDALHLTFGERHVSLRRGAPPSAASSAHATPLAGGPRTLAAPLAGVIVKVAVAVGDRVSARQPLIVLEAMKMEHTIEAPADGVVTTVHRATGDRVQAGDLLIEVGPA